MLSFMQSNGSLRDKVQAITSAHFSAETERTKSKMATTEKGELRMWAPHKFVFALLLRLLRCKITAARRLHSIHSNFFTPLLE